jgi:hypothetical protein
MARFDFEKTLRRKIDQHLELIERKNRRVTATASSTVGNTRSSPAPTRPSSGATTSTRSAIPSCWSGSA